MIEKYYNPSVEYEKRRNIEQLWRDAGCKCMGSDLNEDLPFFVDMIEQKFTCRKCLVSITFTEVKKVTG